MVQAVDESAKLAEYSEVECAGFGERRNLVREGKMFVKR